MQIKKYVLLLVAASLAFAMPNNEGTMGLFRTMSAGNGSAGTFNLGWYMRGFYEDRLATPTGDTIGDTQAGQDATYGGGDMALYLGYAMTDWFSFNIAGILHADGIDYKETGNNRASLGFGDTKLGLKFGFGGESVKYGLYTFLSLPTGSDRDVSTVGDEVKDYPIFNEAYTNPGGVFRYFGSDALDFGGVALLTAKTGMLQFDLNLGYVLRNAEGGGLRNNASIYNVALSLHTPGIIPFVELGAVDYSGKDQLLTVFDDSLWGTSAVYITPGISFRPSKNWHINLAFDFRAWEGENMRDFPTDQTDSFNIATGWGAAPPWAVILGWAFTTDFSPEPVFGDIAGKVVDETTGDNLIANVGIYTDGALVKSMDSDESGQFGFMTLDPGPYQLKVSAADYEPYEVGLLVRAGEVTPITISLKPIPKVGTLIVNVLDIQTKKPVTGMITIGDMAAEKVTGRIEKTLAPGAYKVAVVAEDKNYLPYERVVDIVAAKTLEIEVAMVKKEFKIVLPEVYFETAKSDIKPESYPVLDGAAKTIKMVFEGNPDVKIEVQGHTDSRGSDAYNLNLSNDRAGSVKQYLVLNHNIDADRLIARGYGETKPVASNDSPEGMAKNRRVEFVVMK
ncbi:MAG: OmpA family protein [candidate division WOR-3 bacterium]|nr:MAG: OmpA family protein [candidate division WOR-3 bacterium]